MTSVPADAAAQLGRLCVHRLGARTSSRTTPPPTRSSPTPASISTSARSASIICSPTSARAIFPSAHRAARTSSRGRLRQPKRARKFVYPVYMVYPETRNEEAYEPILERLRRQAREGRLRDPRGAAYAVGRTSKPSKGADALADRLDPRSTTRAGARAGSAPASRPRPPRRPERRPRPSRRARLRTQPRKAELVGFHSTKAR